MSRLFILGILFLYSSLAQADVFVCYFNSIDARTEYSMGSRTFTLVNHASSHFRQTKTVAKNVSFQIMGPGTFELWSSDRQVIQRLRLNYKGSDGTTRAVYPYSVEYLNPDGRSKLTGGCTSNFMRSGKGRDHIAPPPPSRPRPRERIRERDRERDREVTPPRERHNPPVPPKLPEPEPDPVAPEEDFDQDQPIEDDPIEMDPQDPIENRTREPDHDHAPEREGEPGEVEDV